MKKILLLSFMVMFLGTAFAQETKYSTFYYQRETLFKQLPIDSTDIVFLGNSITNGAEWHEIFKNPNLKNRGISGDICQGVYDRLETITAGKPNKIFLMIGINDISRGTSLDSIANGVGKIVDKIMDDSPNTKIYIQSVLPLNDETGMFDGHTKRHAEIPCLNKKLEVLAESKNATYVDLYSHFIIPETTKIDLKYTNDGLHLLGEGYVKWAEIINPLVNE